MNHRIALVTFGLCAAMAASASASPPFLQAGEWQTRTGSGAPVLICHQKDHAMDQAALFRMTNRPGMSCAPGAFNSVGGVTTLSTRCQVAGGTMIMNDTITQQGPDAYTSHIRSHFTGGKIPMPDMDFTQVARRLGPCRPGDRPTPY